MSDEDKIKLFDQLVERFGIAEQELDVEIDSLVAFRASPFALLVNKKVYINPELTLNDMIIIRDFVNEFFKTVGNKKVGEKK